MIPFIGNYTNSFCDPLVDTTIATLHAKIPNDCFSFDLTRSVEEPFYHIVHLLQDAYTSAGLNAELRCYSSRQAIVSAPNSFMVVRDSSHANNDPWQTVHRTINIVGHGIYNIVEGLHGYLSKHLIESKIPTVMWEYLDGTNRSRAHIQIDKAKPIYPEFYPWIGDVDNYFRRYLASQSTVLVILGEPGTAKTSFIRSMIWKHSLNTTFTYDEDLLTSDSMFAEFIVGNMNLLVVEDADVFLKSRQHDGNRIMSKFLNIGDGLASNHRKKIIFTANIVDPSQIDSALIRPGRAFDCLNFRRLTHTEAIAAAKKINVELPEDQREYSLAELFAIANDEPITPSPRPKLGFLN